MLRVACGGVCVCVLPLRSDSPGGLAGGGSELDEDAEDFSFELSEEDDDNNNNRQEGAMEEEDEQAGAVYENGHHSTDPESDSDSSERRRNRKGKAQSNLDAQTQRLVERMQHLRMLS